MCIAYHFHDRSNIEVVMDRDVVPIPTLLFFLACTLQVIYPEISDKIQRRITLNKNDIEVFR